MPRRNQRRLLVPQARQAMNRFKYEVAGELGMGADPVGYQANLDQQKYRAASELGIMPLIQQQGWGYVPSRYCGAVGGRLGGRIGGQMVRRMIALAENNLTGQAYY